MMQPHIFRKHYKSNMVHGFDFFEGSERYFVIGVFFFYLLEGQSFILCLLYLLPETLFEQHDRFFSHTFSQLFLAGRAGSSVDTHLNFLRCPFLSIFISKTFFHVPLHSTKNEECIRQPTTSILETDFTGTINQSYINRSSLQSKQGSTSLEYPLQLYEE